ncbi:MAG: ABC transporter ATP-binding protein/permease [Treponema sp.]|nr:ABC transporter ATP-binding protein/permease [Treponema sp.]
MKAKIKLTRFLKPYIAFVILAPLMMVIEVFMDLQQPALMAVVVNDGILNANMTVIAHTCIKMVCAAVIGLIGGAGCTVFAMLATMNYGADLRSSLFKNVAGFSFNEIDRFSTGSLVTRLTNDVTQLQNMVGMALRMFVRSPLLCIGGIFMAISISVEYGIVLTVVIPILTVLIVFIFRKTTPIFLVMQKKLDKLNAILQENLSGVRVIKAFVRSDYEKKRFNAANEDLTKTAMYAMKVMTIVQPIMMIIMNSVVIAVIYIGGLQVQAAQMRVGDVMAAISYMTQILNTFTMMSMAFVMIPRAQASGNRVREVLETVPSIADGARTEGVKEGSIVFENVSFAYSGSSGDPVLKNISLQIKPGEHIGLLGATGSGKSTLVNLIPRFYDVSSGRILVGGVDIREYNLAALRSGIGFVLQDSVLFSGTILENLKWGKPDAEDDEVIKTAVTAQADEYISAMTDKYQSVIGQRGLTLSGGQKQRACIARALIRDPLILIMDDSTSALDLGTEKRLNAAINSGYSGCTRITIAQRIASVLNTDRIYIIENGTIAAGGTHDELLENSPIYRDIYESQMGQGALA